MDKPDRQRWNDLARAELKGRDPATLATKTPEGLTIQPVYGPDDLAGLALGLMPGEAPYTRGVKATMYAGRPWTIRQYAGFSTAEESNAFYRANLSAGQQGISVAFDLATHRGYDSDHPRVVGDVGKAGVAIDSVEDMKRLFDGIPLDQVSVSMTMNGAVVPVLAMFIVAGEEQGVPLGKLTGTIQNDILKEFMVRNTFIYPPEPSMRLVSDIIAYTAENMPKFNSISISGYHMQEAGATLVQELAYTLADGREYVRMALARGLSVDDFATRLSFFFAIGMDFFMEAAKLRAARFLWHEIMSEFGSNKAESLMLRTYCQTSGVSLQAQDPMNNIIRTAYEALAAVLGGTQSLHTNSYDEAIALPTDKSARVARNTQLILQHETGVTRVADPLAGSYYVESLTAELIAGARALMDEVEAHGGMTKAVTEGLPKARIEEAAAEKQARVDRGETVIVGVNRFQPPVEEPLDIRVVDNHAVRETQVEALRRLRSGRDEVTCQSALAALETGAKGDANLLALTINAARARATLGEISSAMERVFGRFEPITKVGRGIYARTRNGDPAYEALKAQVVEFKGIDTKPPAVLVVKLGQDGHDRGAKVIASGFADLGFDVSSGPLFQTPSEAAELAIASKVDVVGFSSLTAGHMTLGPELVRELKARNSEIIVVAGGVIPEQDYAALYEAGIAAIFGPGTDLVKSAGEVLDLIRKKRGRNW